MEEVEESDSKNIIKLIKDYKQEVGKYRPSLYPVCHLKSWYKQVKQDMENIEDKITNIEQMMTDLLRKS